MTTVYVPYVRGMLREETVAAVPEAEFIELSGDTCYWRLLADIWAKGAGAIIVEQDIAPGPRTIAGLAACRGDWCACTYDLGYGYDWALGCTKFSAQLMRRYPETMDRVGRIGLGAETPDGYPPKVWKVLDGRIIRVLRSYGLTVPHLHPAVRHHKPGIRNARVAP